MKKVDPASIICLILAVLFVILIGSAISDYRNVETFEVVSYRTYERTTESGVFTTKRETQQYAEFVLVEADGDVVIAEVLPDQVKIDKMNHATKRLGYTIYLTIDDYNQLFKEDD